MNQSTLEANMQDYEMRLLQDKVDALQAELARLRPFEDFAKFLYNNGEYTLGEIWAMAGKLLHPAATDTEEGE